MWDRMIYPLVNVYITMERSTIFHGTIHYKLGIFNSILCRRLPEGNEIDNQPEFQNLALLGKSSTPWDYLACNQLQDPSDSEQGVTNCKKSRKGCGSNFIQSEQIAPSNNQIAWHIFSLFSILGTYSKTGWWF